MTTTARATANVRHRDLEQMLRDRRREMQSEVQSRIRHARTDGPNEVFDEGEHSEAVIQEDIEFALIQMKAETLRRIDAALVRLDAGEYGYCFECRSEISERRLRALPFAARCTACEDQREQDEARARRLAEHRRSAPPLFSDLGSR